MRPKSTVPDAYLDFGLASRRDQAVPFDRFHRHNEVELALVESGRVTYLFSHGQEAWCAGDLVVFWGAMPHQMVEADPHTGIRWLTVPLAWFLQWKLPADFAQPILEGAVMRAAAMDRMQPQFEAWTVDLQSGVAERKKIVLLEAEACLRRMALAHLPRASAGPATRRGAKAAQVPKGSQVERLAQFIAEHYTQDLSVAKIAQSVDLHPDYANTVFRKACGRSLIEYVTEHRISHAQRLLATTDRKVLDIAIESGFGSASRFYAVFEERIGCAPRAYRQRCAGGKGN